MLKKKNTNKLWSYNNVTLIAIHQSTSVGFSVRRINNGKLSSIISIINFARLLKQTKQWSEISKKIDRWEIFWVTQVYTLKARIILYLKIIHFFFVVLFFSSVKYAKTIM
jgi:hypothetical protein